MTWQGIHAARPVIQRFSNPRFLSLLASYDVASSICQALGWGTANFHKMGRDKIRLIRDFTKSGVDVLISDIDVAWMRDPTPFFLRYPQVGGSGARYRGSGAHYRGSGAHYKGVRCPL